MNLSRNWRLAGRRSYLKVVFSCNWRKVALYQHGLEASRCYAGIFEPRRR